MAGTFILLHSRLANLSSSHISYIWDLSNSLHSIINWNSLALWDTRWNPWSGNMKIFSSLHVISQRALVRKNKSKYHTQKVYISISSISYTNSWLFTATYQGATPAHQFPLGSLLILVNYLFPTRVRIQHFLPIHQTLFFSPPCPISHQTCL